MRDLVSTLGMVMRSLASRMRPLLRTVALTAGAVFLVMVALAFTRLPYDAHRWLGAAFECADAPGTIVVLGGSGMPSGPELLRLHRAAEAARTWPRASVVIIHPGAPAVIQGMRDEMELRGTVRTRITLLNEGDNTRAQALVLAARQNDRNERAAIVTAPENMRRSVLAFRKAGFTGACGLPAWEHAMQHRFDYDHGTLGGRSWVPDVSERPGMRYTFWNYLKLEVTCMRECMALAYYWLNDWV